MAAIDRIILEPTGDGGLWRVRAEGGDVEGHARVSGLSVERVSEDRESGEALFRVSFGSEDVEGHGPRWVDMPAIPPVGEDAT